MKIKQNDCLHDWDETVYDPHVITEFFLTGELEGHGEMLYEKTISKKVKKNRWSRACKKCSAIEYTYCNEVIDPKVKFKPKFLD